MNAARMRKHYLEKGEGDMATVTQIKPKAGSKKAAPKVNRTAAVAIVKVPKALRDRGVVRITGRSEAKQQLNLEIVRDVVQHGADPKDEALQKKYGIGAQQIRLIVALAMGEATLPSERG